MLIHHKNKLCPHRYPFTPGWREAITVKCLAQGHKCHDRDSNPHSAEQNLQSLNSVLLSARPRHPKGLYTWLWKVLSISVRVNPNPPVCFSFKRARTPRHFLIGEGRPTVEPFNIFEGTKSLTRGHYGNCPCAFVKYQAWMPYSCTDTSNSSKFFICTTLYCTFHDPLPLFKWSLSQSHNLPSRLMYCLRVLLSVLEGPVEDQLYPYQSMGISCNTFKQRKYKASIITQCHK